MADKSVITQEKLQEYHENFVYPYLNGSSHTGFTPVGTVISYFGETAPTHFLICDGTAYNKADYPQLWTHLSSLTDTTPYVVDGDNTKFKVPDLRGEFLRGTGTNSHSGQGSGGDVGVHQDATVFPYYESNNNPNMIMGNYGTWDSIDAEVLNKSRAYLSATTKDDNGKGITSRPTNTSVLFCIAVKDIYIDYALDGFPCEITNPQDKQGLQYDATSGKWINGVGGMHEYSTTEKVVGTWIDGRPCYSKVIEASVSSRSEDIPHDITHLDTVISIDGCWQLANGRSFPLNFINATNAAYNIGALVYGANIECRFGSGFTVDGKVYAILQYTKTTDTPNT